jgi:membrane-bound lytic murein transglycosylase MltF
MDPITAGAALVGGFLLFAKKKLSDLAQAAINDVNAAYFSASIPAGAQSYIDVIRQVADEQKVDPFVIVALGEQESKWGTATGYQGTTGPSIIGTDQHGRGLMQLDDRTWGDWVNAYDWTDPYTNVTKGAQVFAQALSYMQKKGLQGDAAVQAALAGYNAGPGTVWNAIQAGDSPDSATATGSYATEVYSSAVSYAGEFQNLLGGPAAAGA